MRPAGGSPLSIRTSPRAISRTASGSSTCSSSWIRGSTSSGVPSGGQLERALQDHRAGVDALVDEVDRDPEHLDAIGERLGDSVEPGKGRKQRRVDVDDGIREARQKVRAEQLHVPGKHDQLGLALGQPLGDRTVARRPVAAVFDPAKRPRRHLRAPRPLQRRRVGVVRGDRDELDPVAAVDRVEQRLQVGAGSGGKHRDLERSRGASGALAHDTNGSSTRSRAYFPFASSVPASGYSPLKHASQCAPRSPRIAS